MLWLKFGMRVTKMEEGEETPSGTEKRATSSAPRYLQEDASQDGERGTPPALRDPSRSGELDWGRRYKIIEGIARGLLYLHQDSRLNIIHRDLKSSNILLDQYMNPKISDFGLAKLLDADKTPGTASQIAGTNGYMAPEYAMHGRFSTKSDVFSFGVLVLEIVTGRRIRDFQGPGNAANLLSYAWKHWNKAKALDLMDQSLGEEYQREEALRCIHVGLLCVQEDPTERPSMVLVVQMLSGHSSLPRTQSRERSLACQLITAGSVNRVGKHLQIRPPRLQLLLSPLSSAAIPTGFSTQSNGRSPNKVFGSALCRGDVSQDECQYCLSTAVQDILQPCPLSRRGAIWYPKCFLRYSSNNFTSSKDNETSRFRQFSYETQNASEPIFAAQLGNLMTDLTERAAYRSARLFATGEVNMTNLQCTRDQSEDDCHQCLQRSVNIMSTYFPRSIEAMTVAYDCFMGHATYSFYNQSVGPAPPPPPAPEVDLGAPPPRGKDSGKKNGALVIPLVGALVVLSAIFICSCRRRTFVKVSNKYCIRQV
ncbi:cysteine-rich receptor-like protein kinase 10 [Phoenix dactylifera]|uniref:Cysteine-rich receptor-like protein kinase 10 n=1 Tax=Phoenix dactylifera TaxID=42345 RepID=A0A8B9A6A6_PHODC|nr:cysteine-rich receptor-like protein kinase 10 [Phoenix dactylifera]